MKLKLLAALMLTTAASPALAENWVLVTTSDDGGAAILVDSDAIGKGADGFQTVRLLYVLRERTQGLDAILSDAKVDCSGSRIRIGRTVAYDATGKVTGVEEDAPNLEWDPVKDGTNYAGIKRVACGEIPMPTQTYGKGLPILPVRQQVLTKN